MQTEYTLYQNVIENMRDGAIVIKTGGVILLYNPAAEAILGLPQKEVQGSTFAEVFFASEIENEEFNEILVDAVYQRSMGEQRTVVYMRPDKKEVVLAVTSSLLDCGDEAQGVVLVFSDITEMKRLQEQDQENARKLASAYRELEEGNDHLHGLLKRSRTIRRMVVILAVVLFGGLAFYFQGLDYVRKVPEWMGLSAKVDEALVDQNRFTVRSSQLSHSISLTGKLQPLDEIVVSAPFDGVVLEKNMVFGQIVQEGDLLLKLDTAEIYVQLREALSHEIKTRQTYYELRDWENGSEMGKARRNVQRVKSQQEKALREFDEAKLFFSRGIISAQELERAQQNLDNVALELISAQEDLVSSEEKGAQQFVDLAKMEFESAKLKLQDLRERIARSELRAPVSGVVIKPTSTANSTAESQVNLEQGAKVTAGSMLFAIGDLSGLKVMSKVDEVDIGRIEKGQKVKARGDAFPGIVLEGLVSHISAQAQSVDMYQAPSFDVQVTIPEITTEALQLIRVGMTADLDIQVHNNPNALMVPLQFVQSLAGGNQVKLQTANGDVSVKEVKTGITTLGEVEILSGLEDGDILVAW